MPFLFAAGLALFLETAGPLVAIALVEWRLRPRAEAGVWAAGLAGMPAGALLLLAVLAARIGLFVPSDAVEPDLAWAPLVSYGLREGLLAGVMEECVRFGAAAFLFRRATGRPLVAGALFGLGWGAVEVVLVLVQQIPRLVLQLDVYGAAAVPLPFASLLVPAERLGAMLLHVALSGFAVAASMALARGASARAIAFLALAIAAHGVLDAWVLVMSRRYVSQLGAGDGIAGTIALEAVFVAGAVALLLVARRLDSRDRFR